MTDTSLPCDSLLELSRLAAFVAGEVRPKIDRASDILVEALRAGKKVLACGNGGSAADAQHFVTEIMGRFLMNRAALPAISLCTDPSVVTAVSNDLGFAKVFSRQIEGLGAEGDVLLAFSTSGRSPNVLEAVEMARAKNMKVIVLVGSKTNPTVDASDVAVCVPHDSTPRVQEIHIAVLHAICEDVERRMFHSS